MIEHLFRRTSDVQTSQFNFNREAFVNSVSFLVQWNRVAVGIERLHIPAIGTARPRVEDLLTVNPLNQNRYTVVIPQNNVQVAKQGSFLCVATLDATTWFGFGRIGSRPGRSIGIVGIILNRFQEAVDAFVGTTALKNTRTFSAFAFPLLGFAFIRCGGGITNKINPGQVSARNNQSCREPDRPLFCWV